MEEQRKESVEGRGEGGEKREERGEGREGGREGGRERERERETGHGLLTSYGPPPVTHFPQQEYTYPTRPS
jgi:hypothetical protein